MSAVFWQDGGAATSPLPPCGGELERGVVSREVDRKQTLADAHPVTPLPHKGGGLPRLFGESALP